MGRISLCLLACILILGCQPDLTDDEIPYQPFDVININLNLPAYNALRTDGGSMAINEGGVRGIIIYRQNISNYVAYERNCSFEPNSACATVDIDVSTLFMICSCCSSTFDFSTGIPLGGIAWRPLRKYETSVNGSFLIITDQIVE